MLIPSNTVVAYDCSGSTGGVQVYHRTTQAIVNELLTRCKSESEIRVVLWDSSLKESNLQELKRINDKLEGRGGTDPHLVAQALFHRLPELKEHPCRLVVISDGQVSNLGVDQAQRLMDRVPAACVAEVEVHLIGRGVNMSVSCAFTRHAPSTVKVYDDAGALVPESCTAVSHEDLALLDRLDALDTVEEVELHLPAIERAVTVRVMGTNGDRELADALVRMRKRVVNNQAKQASRQPAAAALVSAVRAGEIELALDAARRVTAKHFAPENEMLGLEGRIAKLVSACEGSLRTVFTMQGVRATKLARAAQQDEVDVDSVAVTTAASAAFECPLTLDNETDVVLLFAGGDSEEDGDEGILSKLEAKLVDQFIQCPLAALRNAELVHLLLNRIDHAVSLQSAQEAVRAGNGEAFFATSPFTRRTVMGGLCLGQAADQAKATDWTLARALTRQAKIVGNADLWFAVVWLAMEANWDAKFARLGEVVRGQLRAHMLWRLRNRTSFASLLGLSHVVTTRLPLDVCVWFTLCSSAAAATTAQGQEIPAASDPLRAHLFHYEQLVKLCELAELRLPAGVQQHCVRLKILLHMLAWTKRAGGADDPRFRELVRALHQNALEIDFSAVSEPVAKRERLVPSKYLFVDGEPSAGVVQRSLRELPKFYTEGGNGGPTVGELVYLASRVHPSKSAADVALPYRLPSQLTVMPAARTEWTRDAGGATAAPVVVVVDYAVRICPATLRPWAEMPSTGLTWQEAAVKRYGPNTELLSTYKWFEDYVFKYNVFPENAESFVTYMYNRLCVCGVTAHTTMPPSALEQAEQTLRDYAQAGCGTTLSVDEYKARAKVSRPLPKRHELEQDYLKG